MTIIQRTHAPKRLKKNNWLAFFVMAIVTFIVLLPIIIVILTSLKTMPEIQGPFRLFPESPKFSNYVKAFETGGWPTSLFNTTYITVITTILSLILTSLAAYALACMNFRGKKIIFMLFMAGIMIPPQATIIPQFIMFKSVPLVGGNDLFGSGGSGLINTHWPLLLLFCTSTTGIFLCRQNFLSLPSSLRDAARIDGCNEFQIYWKIYLPVSVPVLVTMAIIRIKATWNNFFLPLVILNDEKLYTVQLNLLKYVGAYNTEWNVLLAAIVIATIPLMVLFVFFQRYFIEGIASSGLKG